jgi:GTPase SAR1 family protein
MSKNSFGAYAHSFWLRLSLALSSLVDRIASFALILLVLLVFTATFVTLGAAWVYLALLADQPRPQWIEQVIFFFIPWFVSPQSQDAPTYAASLNFILTALFAVLSFLFAVWPVLGIVKYRRDLKNRSPIRSFRVIRTGVDDINIMSKYYQNADEVVVYAGDFSWIKSNESLKNIITELANQNKIRLISYKTRSVVENSINDPQLFSTLSKQFVFESKKNIKCSYIKRQNTNFFLYRAEELSISSMEPNYKVFVLRETENVPYLLDILRELSLWVP